LIEVGIYLEMKTGTYRFNPTYPIFIFVIPAAADRAAPQNQAPTGA